MKAKISNGFAVNLEDSRWRLRRHMRTGASAVPTAVAPTVAANEYFNYVKIEI
jgi:hypothetical protein